MKILACVTIADENIIREWDADEKGQHLILANFGPESIAIPLDQTKVRVTVDKHRLRKEVQEGLSLSDELFEALLDAFPRAFLGTLSISDAVIIKDSDSN